MGKKKNEVLTPEGCEMFLSKDYVAMEVGETFDKALTRYLNDVKNNSGLNQSKISMITGIGNPAISKLKSAKIKPTLAMIILLSLAMRLTPDRSEHLLHTAGFYLTDNEEHRIYRYFLYGCAFNADFNIQNCDKVLAEKKFTKLSV